MCANRKIAHKVAADFHCVHFVSLNSSKKVYRKRVKTHFAVSFTATVVPITNLAHPVIHTIYKYIWGVLLCDMSINE